MRTEQNQKNKIIIVRDEQETIRYDHSLPLGFKSIYAQHNPTKLTASCFKGEGNRNKVELENTPSFVFLSKPGHMYALNTREIKVSQGRKIMQ